MSDDQYRRRDPVEQHPEPEYPEQQLDHPGLEGEMALEPDYGLETYRGSGRLEGRKAVITGGDSGIGRAVALAFAREGADVLIAYLPDEEEDARETLRVVEDAGRKAVGVPGDLRDERHCEAVVDRAVEEFGRIDVLVNNAAYQMSLQSGLADLTTEQLLRTYETNVFAMFWLTRRALPHMAAGAAIVNSTSIQAYEPSPQLIDYASTKAAILNFTRALALEVADRGIRVNAVAPGPIWTPLIPATMPPDKVRSFGADTPLGRAAQPVEVAPAYVFLASQESSYITGERIGVTGGKPLP
jgi:NAD(P)-dependent dehydrogenase (short-subunit alcohol dehydrogenase family)